MGDNVERITDAEISDGFYSTLLSNFHPWGTFKPITYLPYGDDNRLVILQCMYLAPNVPGKRPPAAPVH